MVHTERTIRNKKSTHTLLEPHIIEMKVNEGEFFEVEDVVHSHEAHMNLSKEDFFCVLLDTSDSFFTVSPEAKKKIGSKEYARHLYASAFVVNSLATRLAGNFFIRFVKPEAPTRLFSDRETALNWLRSFVS